jgi:hypothetical protein
LRGGAMRRWFGLRCWLQRCPCRSYTDANGAGGECVECGRIVGYLFNHELRKLAEHETRREDVT